jgi:hypothetical protein
VKTANRNGDKTMGNLEQGNVLMQELETLMDIVNGIKATGYTSSNVLRLVTCMNACIILARKLWREL